MDRRLVGLVYASTAVSWAAYSLLIVILPFRFQYLGLSVVQYGTAVAIMAVGMLLTEGIWGVLAFRIGNPRMIIALTVLVGLVYIWIGISDTFLELAVSLGLLGAVGIFQIPLVRWIALTAFGPGTGGRGTGMFGLFAGCGLVVGTALGPFVYVESGFGVLMVLVVVSYTMGLGLLLVLPWHRLALPGRQPGFIRHMRDVTTRPFATAASLVVLAFFGRSRVWNFLQYYSVSLFHGTPKKRDW